MRITRERHVYSLGVSEPVATVTAPCSLTVETCDCFNGQVTEDGQPKARLNFSHGEPGPHCPEAFLCRRALPPGSDAYPGHPPREDRGAHDRAGRWSPAGSGEGGHAHLSHSRWAFTFAAELPIPLTGVIGVAPAGESVPCGTPGDHGGNMDTIGIREGAILRLPVFVKGAYLGLGDLHAAMGDGEVSVTGLEVFGEVDLDLSLEKGASLPCPLLHDGDEVSFLASAETVDGAIHASTGYMHDFLLAKTSLNADEALMLMSLCGHARISQIVDPLKTARFAMPVSVLAKFGVVVE